MAAQNELSALIAKTVEEQTFSLDAIRAIGAIRDRAVSLEAALTTAEKLAADRAKTIAEKKQRAIRVRRQTIRAECA